MQLRFCGATGTVTGSKYLVEAQGQRVLVDCGLFQGYKQLRLRNWQPAPFEPASLAAVLLTHAHLDHSGYLPLLVKQGFRGPVYCTAATLDLCRLMLPDSGRLQEEEAEHANRHGFSRHAPALPLYTEADAVRALEQFQAQAWESPLSVAPAIEARFHPAGHILGAAMLRLADGERSLLFSGDLGRSNDVLMRPPARRPAADAIVVESTYGNRQHPEADPFAALGEVVARTAARGGVVVVPSFTVGRAQTLLWGLHMLKQRGVIPRELPVYLNSPMAIDATYVYRRHLGEHRLGADDCETLFHTARFINTVEESRALNARGGPMVIVAGSGMATGGRVIHHLKAFAPDARNAIVLAGFQAGGTRGAALRDGADSVKIHGEYVAVRAEVVSIDGLSAHADAGEIVDWLGAGPAPQKLWITHGEPAAADGLRRRIDEALHLEARVPEHLETVVV